MDLLLFLLQEEMGFVELGFQFKAGWTLRSAGVGFAVLGLQPTEERSFLHMFKNKNIDIKNGFFET